MKLNVKNETSRLKKVVLGTSLSMGKTPELVETFDAKSYHSVQNQIYPLQSAVDEEMKGFDEVLNRYGVEVLRPSFIEDYNQIFARDVAFVIDDKLVVSNIISDRARELEAYDAFFEKINWKNIINLPKKARVEGGDVILWNDYIFVGTCDFSTYGHLKTARTNRYGIDLLKEYFPEKKIIDFNLKKSDNNPFEGILHLDCTFNIIGNGKCIIYREGFENQKDVELIFDIFGKENCFEIQNQETFEMNPNIFSISPEVVVSDLAFVRLNQHIEQVWGIKVEPIAYREISKMGGLLRCSTLPLERE